MTNATVLEPAGLGPAGLDGRTVVVTGAADGIGAATARAFAAAGADVVCLDIDAAGLARLAAGHPGMRTATVDVCSPAAAGVLEGLLDGFLDGRLDVLANVAGSYARGGLEASSPELLRRVFAVNVVAPTVLTRAALPYLTRAGGSVVNVSSTLGHRPSRSASGYAASKAAVEALTRAWAAELAPRGIRVNAVAPGPVETRILDRAGLGPAEVAAQRRAERERIPLGRLGTPDDVARQVVALAVLGPWVTGVVLGVDGGLSSA